MLLARIHVTLAPDLECAGVLDSGLVVQIEGVENQRLVLRVKNPAKRFSGPAAAVDVKNIGNIELTGPHQFANVAIRGKKLLVVLESALLVTRGSSQFIDLRFE